MRGFKALQWIVLIGVGLLVGGRPTDPSRPPPASIPPAPGPQPAAVSAPVASHGGPASPSVRSTPFLFAENRGQVDGPARFVSLFGTPTWLADDGLRMELVPGRAGHRTRAEILRERPSPSATVTGARVFLTFEGTAPGARVVGGERAPTEANYFIGRDASHWATHVPTWSRLRYCGLYPGVAAEVYGSEGHLEYDLLLEPGADVSQVVVRVEGAEGIALDQAGGLTIRTAAGPLRQSPPLIREVTSAGSPRSLSGGFRVIDGSHYGFVVPEHSSSSRLVIDPGLDYASYLGGDATDLATEITGDEHGAALVAGTTHDTTTFPTTPGAFDTVPGASSDGFVVRFTPHGDALQFSSFIGGASNFDICHNIDLAPDGGICISGGTSSPDFPVTPQAYDTTLSGATDSFVAKLASDGASLVYSTLFGGSADDFIKTMALDSQGRPCIAGGSQSPDFPLTPNAFQTTNAIDPTKPYVARLSADGSTLEFSSLFGQAGGIEGVAVDSSNRMYVCGQSVLTYMPVTPRAFDTTENGFSDGFLAKIDLDVGAIVYSTWLGGSLDDDAEGVAVDSQGRAYVTGSTDSFNFPKTNAAFDKTFNGQTDAFVTCFAPDGGSLVFSTFLGGAGFDRAWSVCVSPLGLAYVTGEVNSSTFPVTLDAFDTMYSGGGDSFLSVLNPDGSKLVYSTFFGSTGLGGSQPFTTPYSVGLDVGGSAYLTGYTGAYDLPVTTGAFDTHEDGSTDAFVVKFDFSPWADLGYGLAGAGGTAPTLTGAGSLQPGSSGSLGVTGAAPNASAWLVVGLQNVGLPLKGGTLVPQPLIVQPLPIQSNGTASLPWASWPTGLPAGTTLYFQVWVHDLAAVQGFAASNALGALTPILP